MIRLSAVRQQTPSKSSTSKLNLVGGSESIAGAAPLMGLAHACAAERGFAYR